MSKTFKVTKTVTKDLIDYNNHIHDAYYNVIFSKVINEFNYSHGLSLKERDLYQRTIFTLETHTTFLAEMSLGQHYTIELFLYDYDEKRTYFFLRMNRSDGVVVATNEVMMGINKVNHRSAHFQSNIKHR